MIVLSQPAIDFLTDKVAGTDNPSINSWGMVKVDTQAGLEIDESTHEPGRPVLRVDVRKDGQLIAVPIGTEWDGRRLLSGGNFVYSGDFRFRTLNAYPIPVHDRARKRS